MKCMCAHKSIHGRMHDEGTEEKAQVAEREGGEGRIRLSRKE